jgi:hypothetical protein
MISEIQLHNLDDLQNYIMEVLLNVDNFKLQMMYDSGKDYHMKSPNNQLRKFISRIILNQRNNGPFYKSLKSVHNELMDHDRPHIEQDHNWKGEIMMHEIESITFFVTGLTQQQMRNLMAVSLVNLYYLKEIPKWKLCIDYQIGMTTLNMLLKEGRDYLKLKIEDTNEEQFKDNILNLKKKVDIDIYFDLDLLKQIDNEYVTEKVLYNRNWYRENRESANQRKKERKSNRTQEEKERDSENSRRYYEKNKLAIMQKNRKYYTDNRELLLLKKKDQKEYLKEYYRKRKAEKHEREQLYV